MRIPILVFVLLLTGCTSTGSASLGPATLDERDGRRLTVTAMHGGCDTLRAPEVDQDAVQVRVEVPLVTDPGDCTDIGIQDEVPFELDQPLGTRPVMDAVTGRALTVVGRDRCRPLEGRPVEELIGRTEEQARTRADAYRVVRVVCVDGRGLDRTDDLRSDRVNLNVDAGRVTSAAVF